MDKSSKRVSGLKEAVVASVLLHALPPFGQHIKERHDQHVVAEQSIIQARQRETEIRAQELHQRREREVRHEFFQRRRIRLLIQAEWDLASDEFQLGRFIIDANEIDQEELGRTFHDELVVAEYKRLFTDFMRLLQDRSDVQSISDALQSVLQNYNYTGNGGSMIDILEDRTGSCEQISELIFSLLYEAGFRNSTGLRIYPPPNPGAFGHVVPILRYQDARHGFHEIDLTDGGPAFPSGVFVDASGIVRAYREQHFGGTVVSLTIDNSTPTEGDIPHFRFPVPTTEQNRPFPAGAVPLFSHGIMNPYRARRGVTLEQAAARDQTTEMGPGVNYFRIQEYIRRNYDPVITDESVFVQQADILDFHHLYRFTDADFARVSDEISFLESRLENSASDAEKFFQIATLLAFYETVERQAYALRRRRLGELAHHKNRALFQTHSEFIHRMLQRDILSVYQSMSRDESPMVSSLLFLGDQGKAVAFRLYESSLQPVDSVHDDYLSSNLLLDLVLNESTRSHALQLLSRLNVRDRIHFFYSLMGYGLSQNDGGGQGAVEMRANDSISIEFTAFQSIITLDLRNRILGDISDIYSLPTQDQREHPIRTLDQLMQYVQVRLAPFVVSDDFKNELFFQAMVRVIDFPRSFPSGRMTDVLPPLLPLLQEIQQYIQINYPDRTEALDSISRLLRVPISQTR